MTDSSSSPTSSPSSNPAGHPAANGPDSALPPVAARVLAFAAIIVGGIAGATLQLKMACAADPQSSFLRSALAELQAELAKK